MTKRFLQYLNPQMADKLLALAICCIVRMIDEKSSFLASWPRRSRKGPYRMIPCRALHGSDRLALIVHFLFAAHENDKFSLLCLQSAAGDRGVEDRAAGGDGRVVHPVRGSRCLPTIC